MNVLVSGATGFVGTALLDRMSLEKCHLRAAVLAQARTDQLPSAVERVVVQPLSDTTEYVDALRGIDVVVHLAARVHVMEDNTIDPLAEFRKVNVAGTERLARHAAAAGVRRLVFMSSINVNGVGGGRCRTRKMIRERRKIPMASASGKRRMRYGALRRQPVWKWSSSVLPWSTARA